MKTFRLFSSAVALSIALATCSTSHALDQIDQAVNQTQVELADALHAIRVDYAAGAINPGMLARVDAVVAKIDAVLQTKPENEAELVELRKTALKFRAQISKSLGDDAGALVNTPIDGMPVPKPLPQGTIVDGTFVDGTIVGPAAPGVAGSYVTSGTGSFASVSSGGGGGGGGTGLLGGGGVGFIALGLGAAGLAVGVSDDNNNNRPGPIASQSSN